MKWLPGPHHKIFFLTQKLIDFALLKIKEHRENFDPSSPRNYIDCFLTEMGDVSGFICLSCVCLFVDFYQSLFEMCQLIAETVFYSIDRRRTKILVLISRIYVFALWTCLALELKLLLLLCTGGCST